MLFLVHNVRSRRKKNDCTIDLFLTSSKMPTGTIHTTTYKEHLLVNMHPGGHYQKHRAVNIHPANPYQEHHKVEVHPGPPYQEHLLVNVHPGRPCQECFNVAIHPGGPSAVAGTF